MEREVADIWIFAPKLFEFSRQKYRGNVIDWIELMFLAVKVNLSRDNFLELLQPMTANPIAFEFSRVLRYVTSKEIR